MANYLRAQMLRCSNSYKGKRLSKQANIFKKEYEEALSAKLKRYVSLAPISNQAWTDTCLVATRIIKRPLTLSTPKRRFAMGIVLKLKITSYWRILVEKRTGRQDLLWRWGHSRVSLTVVETSYSLSYGPHMILPRLNGSKLARLRGGNNIMWIM